MKTSNSSILQKHCRGKRGHDHFQFSTSLEGFLGLIASVLTAWFIYADQPGQVSGTYLNFLERLIQTVLLCLRKNRPLQRTDRHPQISQAVVGIEQVPAVKERQG